MVVPGGGSVQNKKFAVGRSPCEVIVSTKRQFQPLDIEEVPGIGVKG
jgi:hypothetical protein